MKNFKAVLVILMVISISGCSTTPVDPYKPEMSVDRNPAQSKTYNQFRREWEN